jgi:hydroxymethylpyrimidine/phosphomethylpyrimidine kinase
MTARQRVLLTIAGSDSGGGAGIQADLRTFAAHGAFGCSAITAVTAQNTLGVRAVHALPAELVAAQIDAVLDDLGADALKIGMTANVGIAAAIAETLERRRALASGLGPVVLDPVMIAASGDALIEEDAVAVLRERLMPRSRLVTPNLPEGEALAGATTRDLADRVELARELGRFGAAVLLKGAHAFDTGRDTGRDARRASESGDQIVDLLWNGERVTEIRHPRLATRAGHGTGCSLSSAIAARLARGEELDAACRGAVAWVAGALEHAEPLGAGVWPLDHLWTLRAARAFA